VLATANPALVTRLAAAQQMTTVWVNTRSGVYHCSGTLYFGRTSRGEYLKETEAIARGFRANGGERCESVVSTSVPTRTMPVDSRASPGEPAPPKVFGKSCVLRRITDADTVECEGIGKIRLIGIDAPERSQRPFGQMSDSVLRAIVPISSTIDLEFDASAKDRYGRTLAYVWYNGHMVNWQLVRNGWAMSLRYPPDVRYSVVMSEAEEFARKERRGLWNLNGFACIPGARRRAKC